MKAKEKAKELIANIIVGTLGMPTLSNDQAKKCALIVVNEIITQLKQDVTPHEPETIEGKMIGIKYWQDVKKEL